MKLSILVATLLVFLGSSFVFFTARAPIEEDAYISFRYVDNLVQGGGLSFNPGDREEAYSNLSWILLLSIFRSAGMALPLASYIVGMLSAVVLLVYLHQRVHPLAAFLCATSVPFLHWSQHGLETVFYATLITIGTIEATYDSKASRRISTAVWIVAIFTRPEAPLIFAFMSCARGVLALRGKEPWSRFWSSVLPVAGAFLALEAFRLIYHHHLLPNPFYAKPPARSFALGVFYLQEFIERSWLYYVPGLLLVALVSGRAFNRKVGFALCVIVAQISFVLLEGGDQASKPLFRFCIPALPLFFVCAGLWGSGIAERWTSGRVRQGVLVAMALAFGSAHLFLHTERFPHHSRRDQTYGLFHASWRIGIRSGANKRELLALVQDPDYRATNFHTLNASWIRENIPKGSLIAYDQMGQTPHYAGFDYEFLDLFGLANRAVAEIRYHEGGYDNDAYRDYVYSRRPDYIMSFALGHLHALGLKIGKKGPPEGPLAHPDVAHYEWLTTIQSKDGGKTNVFKRREGP